MTWVGTGWNMRLRAVESHKGLSQVNRSVDWH